MTTSQFLSENRQEVINFYNNNIADFYSVSLKDFMLDVLTNFRKLTNGEDFKKFDLIGNLQEAKSRLGVFNTPVVGQDKITETLKNKYKGTAYMAMV